MIRYTIHFIVIMQENNVSMQKQITLFKKTLENYLPRQIKNAEELSNYLSNSIFLISVGSNDYLYNYLQSQYYNSGELYDMDKFGDILMLELQKQLKVLYNLGARKMLVFDLGPIGCFPLVHNKIEGKVSCLKELNTMITVFNGKLYYMLMDLTSLLDGTTLVVAQTYKLIYDMILNPFTYGLKNGTNPCCIVEQKGKKLCVPEMLPCQDRNSNLFWDSFHLTEAAYKIIVNKCLNDSSICTRLSMKPDRAGQPGRRPNAIFCCCSILILAFIFPIHYF
ncbi:GDSL esterase/lipase 7-like [Fagus crenata]